MPMRKRLYRSIRVSCLGCVIFVAGMLAGSRFAKAPKSIDPPRFSPGDAVAALSIVVPEVDLEATPFKDAVEMVRPLSPVPIVVHWDKLAAAGLDASLLVTFRARNVTLGRVLSELVNALKTALDHAAYAPAGDVILISTADDAEPRDAVVRSYDVRDLLRPSADPWAWDVRGFPGPRVGYQSGAMGGQPTPSLEYDLAMLIEQTVAPDSWRDTGGQFGSVRVFAGRLIVTQTWENHRQLAGLLAELREPGPAVAPPPPSADLDIWNGILKRYVSTNPAVGDAALRRHIPEVRFDRAPLEQAIDTLAVLAYADVVAEWSAFEAAGVKRDTPVSLHLRDVTLAEALRALLDAHGAERIHFRIDGGCVILGLPSGGDCVELTTRVYDLRDWLAAVLGPPPTPAPKGHADLAKWAALRETRVESLIKVIEDTIAPDTWKETGGTIGLIKELNGELVVTQTWENQEQVADLLAALRTDPSRLRTPPSTAPAAQPGSVLGNLNHHQ
jgi:hypothetical protein